jgi:hypothetical protein
MPKFKNVSKDDRFIPSLGRTVKAGDIVEVSDDDAVGFAVQVGEPGSAWEAVGAAAKHAAKVADEETPSA